jgi:hypothetical protein
MDSNPGPAGEAADVARVEGVLEGLVGTRARIAALHAEEARLLAEASRIAREQIDGIDTVISRVKDIPWRSMAAQVAAATRISDLTAAGRMSTAAALVEQFPATLSALSDGVIDRSHADVIVTAGMNLPDQVRPVYEAAAVDVAVRETAGRLRPIVRVLAQRLHPVPLDDRHAEAATRRRVSVRDLDDAMAEVYALLPAVHAHAILDRLTAYAKHSSAAADDAEAGAAGADGGRAGAVVDVRSLDERRADVFCDLLLTGHATAHDSDSSIPGTDAIRAHVQITIPVLTLLGRSDDPAVLTGHGPIDPGTARTLAGAASGWDRVLTHPVTDSVLAVDRYTPTEQMKRTLRVRDEHCRFPGCRQPARSCDIDHTIPATDGGPTSVGNLGHLCRRHHVLKHHSAWALTQHPNGVLEWTSPTGRIHRDTPARTLVFTGTYTGAGLGPGIDASTRTGAGRRAGPPPGAPSPTTDAPLEPPAPF